MDRGRTSIRSSSPTRLRRTSKTPETDRMLLVQPMAATDPMPHAATLLDTIAAPDAPADAAPAYPQPPPRILLATALRNGRKVANAALKLLLLAYLSMWTWLLCSSLFAPSVPRPLLSANGTGPPYFESLLERGTATASLFDAYDSGVHDPLTLVIDKLEEAVSAEQSDPLQELRTAAVEAVQVSGAVGRELLSLQGWVWHHVGAIDVLARDVMVEREVFLTRAPRGVKKALDFAARVLPPMWGQTMEGGIVQRMRVVADAEETGVRQLVLGLQKETEKLSELGGKLGIVAEDSERWKSELISACKAADCEKWFQELHAQTKRARQNLPDLLNFIEQVMAACEGLADAYGKTRRNATLALRLPQVAQWRGIEQEIAELFPELVRLARRYEEVEAAIATQERPRMEAKWDDVLMETLKGGETG